MRRLPLLGLLAVLAGLLGPAPLSATGPYMFASFGARQVSNQDMADFFAVGEQPEPKFVPAQLGEGYLTVGYRFTEPFALELAGGTMDGREESSPDFSGGVDLQVPAGSLSLIDIAPMFCFDTFENVTSSWLNQIGLRLEYAQVSGTESLDASGGLSSLNFNGSTIGGGIFYRIINLWAPARLSVGLEGGYDFLRFNDLESGAPTGVFAGQPSRRLQNLNGENAYLDNSGPYIRLVLGWAKDARSALPPRGEPSQPDAYGAYPASPAYRKAAEAALLARARAARKEGDNAGAVECYRSYIQACPTDADAWNELGAIYQLYGRQAFAKQCFDQALKLAKQPKP